MGNYSTFKVLQCDQPFVVNSEVHWKISVLGEQLIIKRLNMPIERRGVRALQIWCRRVTDSYENVNILNMDSSWRDGLAFCALIHHFRPSLIDYESLSQANILENNTLAYKVAEDELGIPRSLFISSNPILRNNKFSPLNTPLSQSPSAKSPVTVTGVTVNAVCQEFDANLKICQER